MITAALFLAGWIITLMSQRKEHLINVSWDYIKKSFPVYLVPFLLAAGYLGMHYLRKGWIGYHEDMPWAVHFQRVDFRGFLRNGLVLAWRLVDNGRLFTWILGILMIIRIFKFKIKINSDLKKILILLSVVLVILSYSALSYRNLSGHRYLIPVFYLVTLTVAGLLQVLKQEKYKMLIATLLLAGMVSGHFWVYPDRISKGWDAMLAYLPYQSLRTEMIRYIDRENIPFQEVGTDFPNNIPVKYIDLSEDTRCFGSIEQGINNSRYILYSNVFNGFSDQDLSELSRNWKEMKRVEKGQVKVILYENTSGSIP